MNPVPDVRKPASLWRRLETWTDRQPQLPPAAALLAAPARAVEIDAAESIVGQRFPPPLLESLLIHDGQTDLFPWLPNQMSLLSVREITAVCRTRA